MNPTLRLGADGHDVGELQQALIEAGWEPDPLELGATAFGPTTLHAVRALQLARGLDPDGIVGPKTWAALLGSKGERPTEPGFRCEPSTARAPLVRVMQAALGEIGTIEDPPASNAGPVLKYGGPAGEPWCAFFVSWCYRFAEPPSPFGVIGWTPGLIAWGRKHGKLVPAGAPLELGDICVILRNEQRGHTFLVAGPEIDGFFSTIGGNERNAVRGGRRRRAALTAVIRPIL